MSPGEKRSESGKRSPQSRAFPSPSYARDVLEPAFAFARQNLFVPMMAANKAHAVMLIEQRVIDPDLGWRLLRGILQAGAMGVASYQYDPTVEDLFFALERRIIELAGEDAGGNLQLGRSRNDLSAALCRMALRTRLLDVAHLLTGLSERIAALAGEHAEALMPGVTHTQEAQPTTLAHYLLGVLGPFERDYEWLMLAYEHTNRSPLGVAAFTTSSLQIDRNRVASLLGFDGLVENGYDAVGAADYMLESVAAMRTMCLNLVRFVNDLLIWARSDVGTVRIGDEFIQISSIMPQKRNPVVLEHIRARIGHAIGDAATVETMVHGAAFGDTVDVEDEIFVPLFRCFDHASSVLTLLSAVLATIEFDRDRLETAALAGFGASTGLAEHLSVHHGLPFRQAHRLVAELMRELSDRGQDLQTLTPRLVAQVSNEIAGNEIELTDDELNQAVDPARFVEQRALPGGPAVSAVRAALERQTSLREAFAHWTKQQRQQLNSTAEQLDQTAQKLAK